MALVSELINVLKSTIVTYTSGEKPRKWLVKAGIKQVTKRTPNLSTTILHGKNNSAELSDAFVKLLMGNDEASKNFRKTFSDMCKWLNFKTNMNIEEKRRIAIELDKQDDFKINEIEHLTEEQANKEANDIIDSTLYKVEELAKTNEVSNEGNEVLLV